MKQTYSTFYDITSDLKLEFGSFVMLMFLLCVVVILYFSLWSCWQRRLVIISAVIQNKSPLIFGHRGWFLGGVGGRASGVGSWMGAVGGWVARGWGKLS